MSLEYKEWGKSKAGNGYGGQVGGRWCAIIETKKGYARGNHVHENDQYTLMISGKLMIVKKIGDEFIETILEKDRIYVSKAGEQHVTLALEDSVGYEWWDGPATMTPLKGVFDKYFEEYKEPIY